MPANREHALPRVLHGGRQEGPFKPTVADYAHNLLAGTALRRLETPMLMRLTSADLALNMIRSVAAGPRGAHWEVDVVTPQRLRDCLRRYLRRSGGTLRAPRAPKAPVGSNLALIAKLVGLNEVQRALLQFLLALHDSPGLKELAGSFGQLTLVGAAALIAPATTLPEDRILEALAPSGRLIASGLVQVDEDDLYELADKIELKTGLVDAAQTPGLDRERLLSRFLPEAEAGQLCWTDFAHIEEVARIARDLLAATLACGRCGVNVLFYGDTGTGKTELAKLLAKDVGARLYVAGRANASGESPTARERLSSLLLGQRLVAGGSALLLFDELEDLFRWEEPRPRGVFGLKRSDGLMSKQWFNHLLESNSIPMIWSTNKTEGIDPAFLRRFAYAVEFRSLGPRQRARVLARHLGDQSAVGPADVDAIAERFIVSPAQFGSAVASARLIAPDGRPSRSVIERVLAPVEKLITGADPSRRPVFDAVSYRIDALNSPADLSAIAERLVPWKPGPRPGISLCLYGPPGTGKSEYAKYLAHRMGRPVMYRHASDILSRWVGETEHLIADAFHQAEDDGAVLLFDEVDSFLRDRQTALHSWEVTEVNEFLQQLESSRGVVACTTNLWRDIDEASLRRFVFKIEFRFLDTEQAMKLFHATFAENLAQPLTGAEEATVRASLARLRNLAPGDFAVVARRERALGRRSTPSDLVATLVAEARTKPGAPQAIGF